METESDSPPLHWPAVAVGAVVLAVAAWWVGGDANWTESTSILPRFVIATADGLEHLPKYIHAVAGVILAIGTCLGAPDAKTSILLSAKSAVLSIAIPVFATLLSYVATAGSISSGMESAGPFGIATAFAVLFAFLAGCFSVAIATWVPVAISAIVSCIVIHFLLNLLNDLPLPWQPAAGETEVDTGQLASDVGLSLAALAVAAVAFGFVPAVSFPTLGLRSNDSVDAVWEKLPSRPSDELWNRTAAGRKRIQSRLNEIETSYQDALKQRCTLQSAQQLARSINSYFNNVRVFEGWTPDSTLSASSQKAKAVVVKALEKKLIGWEQLKPHTRLHLDALKFASVEYEFPPDCP